MRLFLLLPALSLTCLLAAATAPAPLPPPAPAGPLATGGEAVARRLRAELDAARAAPPPAAVRRHPERAQAWRAMLDFYARRGYQPAWWQNGQPRPAALRLLAAIDAAPADGLDADVYPGPLLRRQIAAMQALDGAAPAAGAAASATAAPAGTAAGGARAASAASLDVALTYTFLALAADLSVGRVAYTAKARSGWHAQPPDVDLAAALDRALGPDDDVAGALAAVAPRAAGYGRLRQALARYREIAARGGWPQVPAVPKGGGRPAADPAAQSAALAARLAVSGELPPGAVASEPGRLDGALAAALARFQATHGLASSAGLDAATLLALNVPVESRMRQMELNLERWRWTGDPGNRYILVNIPAFQLVVLEGGMPVLAMKVIVGKTHRRTPVFSDMLTQIVLNPPWNIPDSIAAGEIAPQLLRDPAYLARKGYEVRRREGGAVVAPAALSAAAIQQLGHPSSPLRLVQPPGAANALGHYKFVIPNQFDVYLHDTPNGSLFARSQRDFSHGCIRLERPEALASYLLQGDARWPPAAVAAAVAAGRTVTIALHQPVPVYILYRTAWVDADGTVELRSDLYGQDAWLAAQLAGETPLWEDLLPLRPDRVSAARLAPSF